MNRSLASIALVSFLAACSADVHDPEESLEPVGEPAATELHDDVSTYYVVTRQDFRKCAYPMCGGYFVKRVNRAVTQCANGSWAKECHMVDLDLSALGVGEDEAGRYRSEVFGQQRGLVRGKLQSIKGANTLVASEAWEGATGNAPIGDAWRVNSSGIVCITSPCPSYQETHLNTGFSRNIHGVDLFMSGASEEQLSQGYQQMADDKLLVTGLHVLFKGMHGKGIALWASEFYLPLQGSSYCGSVVVNAPHANSPTYYAKNFTSEKEAWSWLGSNFPHGDDAQVWKGACNEPRMCMTVYQPVCGVVKDSPPSTYGNSCNFEGAILADAGSTGESKGFYTKGECGAACDYSDPSRNYLAQSPEQCALIKFYCQSDQVPFFDDCGCGCEVGAKK